MVMLVCEREREGEGADKNKKLSCLTIAAW